MSLSLIVSLLSMFVWNEHGITEVSLNSQESVQEYDYSVWYLVRTYSEGLRW